MPFPSDCDRVTSAAATLHTAVPYYWSGYQEVQHGHHFLFVATLFGVAVAFIKHLLFLTTAARICTVSCTSCTSGLLLLFFISSTAFIDLGSSQLCSRRNIHYLERTEPSVPVEIGPWSFAGLELNWTGLGCPLSPRFSPFSPAASASRPSHPLNLSILFPFQTVRSIQFNHFHLSFFSSFPSH